MVISNPIAMVPRAAKVRIAERSVEGRHSLVHRTLERAPRASLAYLSSEVRFKYLQAEAATQPQAFMTAILHVAVVVTLVCLLWKS